MNEVLSSMQPKDVEIPQDALKKIFSEHLNYIYFGKKHLADFFTEVKSIATLDVLKMAIQECLDDTFNQTKLLKEVYSAIEESPAITTTLSLKATTLEAYLSAIKQGKTPHEKD